MLLTTILDITLLIVIPIYVSLIGVLIFVFKRQKTSRFQDTQLLQIDNHLFCSLLIPFKNEAKALPQLIKEIRNLSIPSSTFEVILIDDNSTDKSKTILSEALESFETLNWHILKNPGIGKKSAITFGVENSNSELIVLTDVDCSFSRNWLESIVELHKGKDAKMIIGPVIQLPKATINSKIFALDFLSLVGTTASFSIMKRPVLCNGANLAFEKNAFLKVNGYSGNDHIKSGDDVFLLHKFKQHYPKNIYYNKNYQAIVYTEGMDKWKDFIEQRLRWIGKSKSYRDLYTISLSLIILIVYSLQIGLLIASIYKVEFLKYFLLLFVSKLIIDVIYLFQVNQFFKVKGILKYALITGLFQILYTPLIILMSFVYQPKWK